MFIVVILVQLGAGLPLAWTQNFWATLVLEIVTSIGTGGLMVISFLLLFEILGEIFN